MELIETTTEKRERATLVGLHSLHNTRWEVEDHLGELKQLAETAGAEVVYQEIVKREKPTAAYFIGKGKVEEIKMVCESEEADLVIFDDDLSPAQQRNLELIIEQKIIDRTELIMDIFAQRAKTKEAKLQVELAQLQYLLPRLTRRWTHLSKQLGGIGTRGPGETQLEVDRRRVREKIYRLNVEIKEVRQHRKTQRKGRKREDFHTAVIIGYTNAGKSTLFNSLTGASVAVEDKLFATLDPATKKIVLPNNQKVLISDTVGFIRKLPHHLVESFMATLEEVIEADLLVHILDISHPQAEEQSDAVYAVLEELHSKDKPIVTALNKIDKIQSRAVVERYKNSHPYSVAISALKKIGFDDLCKTMEKVFADELNLFKLRIPQRESRLISRIYSEGRILAKRYENNSVFLEAELPIRLAATVRKFIIG